MKTIDLSNLSIENIKILNLISDDINNEFNSLTEEIFNQTNKSIDRLVSSTLSRNPYLSDIYINVCYLLLIKKLLREDVKIKNIIVPNNALKKVLNQYTKENNFKIKVICKKKNLKYLKSRIKPIYRFIQSSIKFFHYWLLKNKIRRNRIQPDQEITLIDTFFQPSMFKSGKFKDRYYNGLLLNLSKQEREKIYFVPTVLIKYELKKIIKISESSDENFIYKFDYLKLKDYLYALISPLRIKRINFNQFIFHGFKVGVILSTDFSNNIVNDSSLRGILNYLFLKRLKENSIKLKLVIDWFENQVIDRGFNKGLHDFYPNTQSIGYQGFTDYISSKIPTKYEVDIEVIPDEIAVVGKGLTHNIKKYNKDLKVIITPAFRFQGVWESINSENNKPDKIVLIALPISKKDSVEILKLVIDSKKNMTAKNIIFYVKTHPSVNIQDIKASFHRSELENYIFVDGDFKKCVSKARVMLGNASSTCLETLAIGIPVIIVGSQSGLTQNPIPESVDKKIWRLCYTPNELSSAINHFVSISDEDNLEFKEIGKKIRNEYFEPVTKISVKKFLSINNVC